MDRPWCARLVPSRQVAAKGFCDDMAGEAGADVLGESSVSNDERSPVEFNFSRVLHSERAKEMEMGPD